VALAVAVAVAVALNDSWKKTIQVLKRRSRRHLLRRSKKVLK
jgi:hypothetical protein